MSARETEQARMEGGERVDGGGECWGGCCWERFFALSPAGHWVLCYTLGKLGGMCHVTRSPCRSSARNQN